MSSSLDASTVQAQLDRVLASPVFVNADRLSRFLRFVVERTLAGEGDRLKEYVLATEVFDRPADYDPRLDSIVRVEARRLRSKLADYYSGPGLDDLVVIHVDKGSYAARFEARSAAVTAPGLEVDASAGRCDPPAVAARPVTWTRTATRPVWIAGLAATMAVILLAGLFWRMASRDTASASTRIAIAVLPLARYDADVVKGEDPLADAVTDGLIAELARQPALDVTSRTTAMQYRDRKGSLREIAAALGVRAVLEGTVRVIGPRLEIEIRIVDAERDRKVWVDELVGEVSDRRALERRVADRVARMLQERFSGGPVGSVPAARPVR